MSVAARWALAAAVVLLDFVTVGVPLAALLVAYAVIARPAWWRRFWDRVYRGP